MDGFGYTIFAGVKATFSESERLNLKTRSAVVCVSLRPLRFSCRLTQRTLRNAEDAEKSINLRHDYSSQA